MLTTSLVDGPDGSASARVNAAVARILPIPVTSSRAPGGTYFASAWVAETTRIEGSKSG
ncbi:Uncharacterised protein [Mycobacteroides abscessus subsp. abscessus]|nr:Uncharacterised protein [Mycobacteroides abscessus subsp. abscessus]